MVLRVSKSVLPNPSLSPGYFTYFPKMPWKEKANERAM